MFTLHWTAEAASAYDELRRAAIDSAEARKKKSKTKSSQGEGLFKQFHKTLVLLQSNPRRPGLNTHEYASIVNPFDSKKKVFEAYAQNKTPGAYRVFWCYGPGQKEITIIAITAHP